MKLNLPELAEGEIYVGCIGDALGNLHHVILLPGDNDDDTHEAMSRISPSYVTGLEKYIDELLNQVSSLKAELREICATIDDPACDLTLTAVECIKKLKAENESLKRDAERYQWLKSQEPSKHDGYAIGYFDACGVDAWRMATKDLDQAIDAAMSHGEQI